MAKDGGKNIYLLSFEENEEGVLLFLSVPSIFRSHEDLFVVLVREDWNEEAVSL